MAETLEQKANAPQQDKSEGEKEKKKQVTQSALEEIAEGSGRLMRTATAVSLPVLADLTMGGFGATSTAGAFYLAEKRHPVKLSLLGTAFAVFANYTLAPISAFGFYARAGAVAAWNLAATAYYMLTKKIIYRESFKGFWSEYKGISKKVLAFLYLPTLLTTYLNLLWQVPAIALQGYLFKRFIAKDKKEPEQKDKTPYSAAIRNVSYRIFNAPYDIGKAIYEATSPKPKQVLAPAPAK